MGIPWDDMVVIKHGKEEGEASTMITVNCPDKTGLGCDLCRIVVEFGLSITKGDICTDGNWCFIVLWTAPQSESLRIDWESLKTRLLSVCPSCLMSFYFTQQSNAAPPSLYMLKVFCLDRKGLLHDVTKSLCQLELTIQRVKVMTNPDGKVLNLFFITDSLDLLHLIRRREETCEHLSGVLGDDCIGCELQPVGGPEYETQLGLSSFSEIVSKELFSSVLSDKDASLQKLSPDMTKIRTANTVVVDNYLSPAHTLLQIQCADQKSLVYDILRTSKDLDIQISYGRMSLSQGGTRSVDLFIRTTDGKKITGNDNLLALCSRLKEEMLHPLRVTISNRGPDTELLVANSVELSGKGRPRVFYDVTLALKKLSICVFSAEIGRHSTKDREWEVYRFLLDESRDFPLASSRARNEIVDRVRRTLMGW